MSKTNAHYTEHTLEDANAMPEYDECVNSDDKTPDLEQYRKDTEEMRRLDEKWKNVYPGRKAFLDYEQEFLERELEKGGRHDWQ